MLFHKNPAPPNKMKMPIPAATRLVASCWQTAEERVRELADRDEEYITGRFHEEFALLVTEQSQQGAFEKSFRSDLSRAFGYLVDDAILTRIPRGVKAKVTFHDRQVEGKTGGDLGLVVCRPDLSVIGFQISIEHEYERGLLCQAKLKRRAGAKRPPAWGAFTKKQCTVLGERIPYLALLLYEYDDEERGHLKPFQWQVCAGFEMEQLRGWVKSGLFPSLAGSACIIDDLAADRIGTDHKQTIEEIICPPSRSVMKIVIGWDPGDRPEAVVRNVNRQRTRASENRLLA